MKRVSRKAEKQKNKFKGFTDGEVYVLKLAVLSYSTLNVIQNPNFEITCDLGYQLSLEDGRRQAKRKSLAEKILKKIKKWRKKDEGVQD